MIGIASDITLRPTISCVACNRVIATTLARVDLATNGSPRAFLCLRRAALLALAPYHRKSSGPSTTRSTSCNGRSSRSIRHPYRRPRAREPSPASSGRHPMTIFRDYYCRQCGSRDDVEERYSLGVYYALLCSKCWSQATVRKEGAEGFDPRDAGESLEPEDGEAWP